ncbi:MAG: hypothetical protein GY851_10455 [bacterium]|nr:hypothetical protein [bacterium]
MTAKAKMVVLMCLLALVLATGVAVTATDRTGLGASADTGVTPSGSTHVVAARGYERFHTTDIAAP